MTIEERIAEKVARGWTPLEAEELVDIEDGRLLPADAELVNCVSSDDPAPLPITATGKQHTTEKQQENLDYLKAQVFESWKAERTKLAPSEEP